MNDKKQLIKLVLAEYADKIATETINNIKKDTKPVKCIENIEIQVLQEVVNILTKKLKKVNWNRI